MKLYSWNMFYRNPDLDRAFSFVKDLDFDVLCLQEVPEPFLERLEALPFQIAYGREFDLVDHGTENAYGVILSRHPIVKREDFALPDYMQPLRTRMFARAMHPIGWRRALNRRSLFADIETPEYGPVRVFCLHLTLSYPSQRARELSVAMQLRLPAQAGDTSLPTIVCGDFNVLEMPHITILNWLLGGRLRDIFAWRSERRNMERKFAELGLQNPLRGTNTQTISCSQLDHILVPKNVRILQARVIPDRFGSDHHPIVVESI